MPKLSTLQWLILATFLVFYGFAVFALTRDYYARHPIRPSAGARALGAENPHAGVQRPALAGISGLDLATAVPESIEQANPILLGERADRLLTEGRFREAIPLYKRVLELAPEDSETYNDLGLALHYAGESASALEVLRRGAARDPSFQRIWLTLGFVNLQTQDANAAREALGRARDLGPESSIGEEAIRLLGAMDQP